MLVHVTPNLAIRGARFTSPSPLLLRVSTSYENRGVRMVNSGVEEWVLSSTVVPGDEGDTRNHVWDKNRILAEWEEGIQIIQTNLSSSSTKTRVEFLEAVVVPLVKDESEFFKFYPRGSRRSRD